MGPVFTDRGLVLCLPDGRLYHPERVSTEFDRRVEKWGLQRITSRGLRPTWATLALRAGAHPKVVPERLGHSTIGVTLNTYSHVSIGMQRDAAETVTSTIQCEAEQGGGTSNHRTLPRSWRKRLSNTVRLSSVTSGPPRSCRSAALRSVDGERVGPRVTSVLLQRSRTTIKTRLHAVF